jgi:predicted RNase H-like HicB family nuclease
MERIIRLRIEKLPEGVYLVTSDDVQGLVTEAPTLQQAIEWGRENARILLELQNRRDAGIEFRESLEVPVVIAA